MNDESQIRTVSVEGELPSGETFVTTVDGDREGLMVEMLNARNTRYFIVRSVTVRVQGGKQKNVGLSSAEISSLLEHEVELRIELI